MALHRLKKNSDFEVVFKSGRTSESSLLKIKILANRKSYSRFGFVVGTKFDKKATARNLMKRRLKETARFLERSAKPGFDIVVWPKTGAKSAKYRELFLNLKELFIKNDLLLI